MKGDLFTAKQCIADGCPVDALCCNGWTALMLASFYGQEDMIIFLVGVGAGMNIKNKAGRTPLHYAIKKRRLGALRVLLSLGADPNIPFLHEYALVAGNPMAIFPQTDVELPLIEAVQNNDREVLGLLASCPRINLNAADDMGNTAIMYASSMGLDDVVRDLHSLGADVNQPSTEGGSALLAAMYAKKFKTALLLLDLGADPRLHTTDGENPYQYAVQYSQKAIQERILNYQGYGSV